MEVDIEDRDTFGATVEEALRRNGCIVEETVAAIHVVMSMMAGRPAEREGRGGTRSDEFLCRLCNRSRSQGRIPGASRYAGLHREYIVADLAVDMARLLLAHTARGKAGRDDLAAKAGLRPFNPGILEESEKFPVMDLAQRLQIELRRRHEIGHLAVLQLAQDIFDARGALEGRDELAAIEFALREMQPVILGIDDFHAFAWSLRLARDREAKLV